MGAVAGFVRIIFHATFSRFFLVFFVNRKNNLY